MSLKIRLHGQNFFLLDNLLKKKKKRREKSFEDLGADVSIPHGLFFPKGVGFRAFISSRSPL